MKSRRCLILADGFYDLLLGMAIKYAGLRGKEVRESSVTSAGGTTKSEVWGKRRLAYRVGKFNDGIFVLMMIEATGAVVHEVERRLRVTEPVIKFLTVRTDEELKRLDKIKKLRDAKKKVSAQPAAAAAPVTPATPVTPEAGTEAPASTPA